MFVNLDFSSIAWFGKGVKRLWQRLCFWLEAKPQQNSIRCERDETGLFFEGL
jgi:hypothetical protein